MIPDQKLFFENCIEKKIVSLYQGLCASKTGKNYNFK